MAIYGYKAKIYLDFLPLCGKGVFYIELTLFSISGVLREGGIEFDFLGGDR